MCAAPVQRSQNTPDTVDKCGETQVPSSYAAPDVPPAKSPFWSWAVGPSRICHELAGSFCCPVGIWRTPRTALIGEEACPLQLNRPTPQGSKVGDLSCQCQCPGPPASTRPSIPSAPKSDARNLYHVLFAFFAIHHHQARPSLPSTSLLQGSAARFCLACPCVKASWVLLTPRPAARLDTQSYTPCETTRPREELGALFPRKEQIHTRHGHERFLHKPHKAVELRGPCHSHPPAICITLPLRNPHPHPTAVRESPLWPTPGLARSAQHLGLRSLLFASPASYNIREGLLSSPKPTDRPPSPPGDEQSIPVAESPAV